VFASDDADCVAGKVIPAPEAAGVALPTPIVEANAGVLFCVMIVPVSLGSESVKLEFVFGAAMVSVPEPLTFPSMATLLI
jgi:hypothetical protein